MEPFLTCKFLRPPVSRRRQKLSIIANIMLRDDCNKKTHHLVDDSINLYYLQYGTTI